MSSQNSHTIAYNQRFVIETNKNESNDLEYNGDVMDKYRPVLKYSSSLDSDIFIDNIRLDLKRYQNLFVLVIEKKDLESKHVSVLLPRFAKLLNVRTIVLQAPLKDNTTKFYLNYESFGEFFDVEQKYSNVEDFADFPSFLCLLLKESKNIKKLECKILNKLPKVKDSSIILRFIGAMEFSEFFFEKLAIRCAAFGSRADIFALISGFVNDEEKIDGLKAEYLSKIMNSSSILYTAVKDSNKDLVEYLTRNCTHFIQNIPLEHQIEISSLAFLKEQYDFLCDLLQFSDFPFPENFSYPNSIQHQKLREIIKSRTIFHAYILSENLKEIENYCKNNPNIKIACDLKNNSALFLALDKKKFKSFFLLKSLSFEDTEIKNIFYKDVLEVEDDIEKANRLAIVQRIDNVKSSTPFEENPKHLLLTRSLIFSRRSEKPKQQDKNKIDKWFDAIYKTEFGKVFMDVASQCGEIKIIFDFECDSVEHVDVTLPVGNLGATYAVSKFIFIGAKSINGKEREQEIKGVIAHELGHFVMRLVYDNNERPYYEHNSEVIKLFNEIVQELKLHLANGEDDMCNTIISSVFKNYDEQDHDVELIVRPAHIQAEYDNDNDKCRNLEKTYNKLFNFLRDHVMPDLKKFNLKQQENVQSFNNDFGFISEIKKLNVELTTPYRLNEMQAKYIVIKSNIPKLVFASFYTSLFNLHGKFIGSHNIFITSEKLKKSSIFTKLKEILKSESQHNIFFDCSRELPEDLKYCFIKEPSKFIFVVSNACQHDHLINIFSEINLNSISHVIDYKWTDLKPESQTKLLNTSVCFQENSDITLSNLTFKQESENNNFEHLSEIFDEHLLNILMENSSIFINANSGIDFKDNLFQKRKFIKNNKKSKTLKTTENSSHKEKLLNQLEELKSNDPKESFKSILNLLNPEKLILRKKFVSPQHAIGKLFEPLKKMKEMFSNMFEEMKEFVSKDSESIELEQIFLSTEKKQYVLISDNAGTGKSWALKNITKELQKKNNEKWINYIDLKLFIDDFKKAGSDVDFASFITEKILKLKNNFEKEIFKNLYKNGKICIIFDGFDEIAPDYADFVKKLFYSVDHNDGNQIWIASRDFYEVDLVEKLKLDDVYKLDCFTNDDGIYLIASNWIINEINLYSKIDIEKNPNFEKYKNIAENLCKKIIRSKTNLVGCPQFYKMIADVFENEKNTQTYLTTLKVYDKFVDIQCEKWSKKQGPIRCNENIEIRRTPIDFREIHQMHAMQSLFPDDTKFCDLDFKDSLWTDSKIVAFGLLSKKGEYFLFSHETFREYFAADFIVRILYKTKFEEDVCNYLLSFLTIRKFGIIRMFLNEAFGEEKTIEKITPKIQFIAAKFYEKSESLKNLSEIFDDNHEYLANFIIKIFKFGKYEDVKQILNNNDDIIFCSAKLQNLFIKIQDFIFNFFNTDDLTAFIKNNLIIHKVINSTLKTETIKNFLCKTKEKTGPEFIIDALKMSDKEGDNVFGISFHSQYTKTPGKTIEILQDYFDQTEIIKLIKQNNKRGFNLIHNCIKVENEVNLAKVWQEIEIFFNSCNLSKDFKDLCRHDNCFKMFQLIALCDNTETHKTFWNLLCKTFDNTEELKDLIMKKDDHENNFPHILVHFSTLEVTKYTFEKFKEIFNSNTLEIIFKSKGFMNNSLLETAINMSKNVEIVQIIWKTLSDTYESEQEFSKFLESIIRNAGVSAAGEIFKFIFEEFEKITTIETIRKVLSEHGECNQIFLQQAAMMNESIECHDYLWFIIRKYFKTSEILHMIEHVDENENNILFNAIVGNTEEIVKKTWNEIKEELLKHKDCDILHYLKYCKSNGFNILNTTIHAEDHKKLIFIWEELEKIFSNENAVDQFLEICRQKTKENLNILQLATSCRDINFHKALWNLLEKTFKNVELKNLVLESEDDEISFLLLLGKSKAKIIEYTFEKFKEIFEDSQYIEILNSKTEIGLNLLQLSACTSEKTKNFKALWKVYKDFFKSDNEFLNFLKQTINAVGNIFHLTASHSHPDIFEYIFEELKIISSHDEIKSFFTSTEFFNHNILQLTVKHNKSKNFYKSLWKIIETNFNDDEILEMIIQCDDKDEFLLPLMVRQGLLDELEITWNKLIDIVFSFKCNSLSSNINGCNISTSNFKDNPSDEKLKKELIFQLQIFTEKLKDEINEKKIANIFGKQISSINYGDLHKLAACNKIEVYKTYWEKLFENFHNVENLKRIILQKNEDGNNFVHLIILNNNFKIIEYTFEMFKKNFNEAQYHEILLSKGSIERNLLQIASCSLTSEDVYNFLWKILKDICKYNKNFQQKLMSIDDNIKQIYETIDLFDSDKDVNEIELFKSVFLETMLRFGAIFSNANNERDLSLNMMSNMLRTKKNVDLSSFHQTIENDFSQKNSQVHTNFLWKIVSNDFKNTEELMKFIFQIDENGNNVVHVLTSNENGSLLDVVFKKLQENLSKEMFQKILKSRGKNKRNLIQIAVSKSAKNPEVLKLLLKLIQDSKSFNDEEFWKCFDETDENGLNVFQIAVSESNGIIFEILCDELVKVSPEILKKLFGCLCKENLSLLQSATKHNKDLKLHKKIWEIINTLLTEPEIIEMIFHTCNKNLDFFEYAICYNTEQIIKFTWDEISNVLQVHSCFDEKLSDLRDVCFGCVLNFIESSQEMEKSRLLYHWNDLVNKLKMKNVLRLLLEFMNHSNSSPNKILDSVVSFDNLHFHSFLWNTLQENFKDDVIMCKFILQKDEKGNNFIHKMTLESSVELIRYTFSTIKDIFNEVMYKNILLSKGVYKRNLLQSCTFNAENIETYTFLWNVFQNICDCNEEFLDIVGEVDENGLNTLHIAVLFSPNEIFTFIIKELTKAASKDTIKMFLRSLGILKMNLLQTVTYRNASVELCTDFWKTIQKYFNHSEIYDMITYTDGRKLDLLQIAINYNSNEIIELTWKKVNEYLFVECQEDENCLKLREEFEKLLFETLEESLDADVRKYIDIKWIEFMSSIENEHTKIILEKISKEQIPLNNLKVLQTLSICDEIDYHISFWKTLLKNSINKVEITNLLIQKDKDGNGYINHLVFNVKISIIEFTFKRLEYTLGQDNYKKILETKGKHGRHLLQTVAVESRNLALHKCLWNIFQNFYKSNDDYITFLMQPDDNGECITHIAASFTTSEIFNDMIGQFKMLLRNKDQIKNDLSILGAKNRNILQIAAANNESIEFHQYLWEPVQKYFDHSEILQLTKHIDMDGNSLLHIAVIFNTKEIISFTWNQIKNFLTSTIDKIEYLKQIGQDEQNVIQLLLKTKRNNQINKDCTKALLQQPKISNDNKNKSIQNEENMKRRRNNDSKSEDNNESSTKKQKICIIEELARKRTAKEIEEANELGDNTLEKRPKLTNIETQSESTLNNEGSSCAHQNQITPQNHAKMCLVSKIINVPIDYKDLTVNLKKLLRSTRNQDENVNSDHINILFDNEFNGTKVLNENLKISADETSTAVAEVLNKLNNYSPIQWKDHQFKKEAESLIKASFDVIAHIDNDINEKQNLKLNNQLNELNEIVKKFNDDFISSI